jgi:hypothetical protein
MQVEGLQTFDLLLATAYFDDTIGPFSEVRLWLNPVN